MHSRSNTTRNSLNQLLRDEAVAPAGLRCGGRRHIPVPEAQLQGGRVLLPLLLALRRVGVLPIPEAQLLRLLGSA